METSINQTWQKKLGEPTMVHCHFHSGVVTTTSPVSSVTQVRGTIPPSMRETVDSVNDAPGARRLGIVYMLCVKDKGGVYYEEC